MNRKTASGIVAGIFVIAFGLLILLKAIFGWAIGISASSFWAIVIIAVSVISIIDRGLHFFNVLFLIIGGWIFLGALGFLGKHVFLTLVAVVLVAIGIRIVMNAAGSVSGGGFTVTMDDYINYDTTFANCKISNSSKDFKGGHITCLFGRLTVDLSQIQIQSNSLVDVSSVFGTIEIIMPRDIPYNVNVMPVLGTFVNNAPFAPPVHGKPFITVKGSAVFGNCELR